MDRVSVPSFIAKCHRKVCLSVTTYYFSLPSVLLCLLVCECTVHSFYFIFCPHFTSEIDFILRTLLLKLDHGIYLCPGTTVLLIFRNLSVSNSCLEQWEGVCSYQQVKKLNRNFTSIYKPTEGSCPPVVEVQNTVLKKVLWSKYIIHVYISWSLHLLIKFSSSGWTFTSLLEML